MPTWYDEPLEARARTHERVQAILFVLRFGLMFALASIFWLSGWATALAEGLRSRFLMPYTWPLVHVLFVALAVFGYEAILFPLSVLADHFPERSHDHPQGAFGQWLRGYLTSLVLEIALVTAVFAGLYVLMRYFPTFWWLPATGIYAALVVGLGEWGPSQLLPRVRPPVAVNDVPLEEELRRVGRLAGLEITGASWWDFEHQEDLPDSQLTGRGRRRHVVYSERVWRGHEGREQVFVAARQMAWLKNHAAMATQSLQIVLAAGVFWGAERLSEAAARIVGLDGLEQVETFPFLVMSLFGLAALAGIVAHAVERHMELRADRFALLHAGGPEALLACLRKEFEHGPFAVDPPTWQVLLLHRKPTATRRLVQAASLRPEPPADEPPPASAHS